jgi:uncharacterized protein (TIGR00730 family)
MTSPSPATTTRGRLCVFCGSSDGRRPEYRDAAAALGRAIATHGLGLVYGGSNIGLMRAVADAAIEAGGDVIGVIPGHFVSREIEHRGLTELRVVDTMHERKAMMADLADGFVALPGGYGTLDELCEILTWSQLRLHDKPCAILNTAGYFDGLLTLFDRARQDGFLYGNVDGLIVDSDPDRVVDRIVADARFLSTRTESSR